MANMTTCAALVCVLVALQVVGTLAASMPKLKLPGGSKNAQKPSCKNFNLSITKLEVCPESMVTFQDFNISLSDDCQIIPTGCVSSKAFETATINYEFNTTARIAQNGNEHHKGTSDACKDLENIPEDALAIMKAMQLSTACPMPDAKQCATPENAIDMKKFKKFIPLMWLATGNLTGDINIKYNNGVSCVKFEARLVNLNGRAKKNPLEVVAGQAAAKALAMQTWAKILKERKQ